MELGIFPYRYTLWGYVMQTFSDPAYQQTPGAEGFTIHSPWMHHYLQCFCNLSQHCFINPVRCRASLHVPACIFSCCGNPTLLSQLSPKPIAPRWSTKSSRLCQRASTDLLSSYFQHFLFRRSAMTAPLSLLAGRLWHVSGSEFQHARRHLIRQRANRCVSWTHT